MRWCEEREGGGAEGRGGRSDGMIVDVVVAYTTHGQTDIGRRSYLE
jgi:hypothetical protein